MRLAVKSLNVYGEDMKTAYLLLIPALLTGCDARPPVPTAPTKATPPRNPLAAPEPDGFEIGRFQLIPAQIKGDNFDHKKLFRIDTATGLVWQYRYSETADTFGTNSSTYIADGWSEVCENYSLNFSNIMQTALTMRKNP